MILKNQNYFNESKKIWDAIDENKRISKTIEGNLISKIDEFNAAVLKKFPELSQIQSTFTVATNEGVQATA